MTAAARARASWVEDRVRAHCFGDDRRRGAPLTFGAELELLAFDAVTRAVAPILSTERGTGSLDAVRDVARRLAWCERLSDKGVPKFSSAGGGSLTFEPGGQLEYASAVHHSLDHLLAELGDVEAALCESAGRRGIELLALGIDPYNRVEAVALQLDAPRYRRMAGYFATIGPDGARMMRQTASLQINIGGVPTLDRFAVANSMAPVLVALFANSSRYAAADTPFASYRSEIWRHVDAARTGLVTGVDPVRRYAAFALAAPAFLADASARPFGELPDELASEGALLTHFTTLFPEVRPRGYLEVRSVDAIGPGQRAAALALVAGVLGDADAARDALDLLGAADAATLRTAAESGTRDPHLAGVAGDLIAIAMRGCDQLGVAIVSEEAKDAANATFRERLVVTRR